MLDISVAIQIMRNTLFLSGDHAPTGGVAVPVSLSSDRATNAVPS